MLRGQAAAVAAYQRVWRVGRRRKRSDQVWTRERKAEATAESARCHQHAGRPGQAAYKQTHASHDVSARGAVAAGRSQPGRQASLEVVIDEQQQAGTKMVSEAWWIG